MIPDLESAILAHGCGKAPSEPDTHKPSEHRFQDWQKFQSVGSVDLDDAKRPSVMPPVWP
jgi:hypothetical protein